MEHTMKVIFTVGLCGGNALSNIQRKVKYKNTKGRLMKDLLMVLEFCITRMELYIRGISYRGLSTDMGFLSMALRSINVCI